MEEDIKELLEIVVKRYIEEYIINLDLSDSTKNILKRQLRKTFLDEDLLYDLGTIAHKNSIPTSKIRGKIEELDIQISECEYADDDIEERKQDIEKEKRLLLRDKKTLQELLERSREDANI